ncbi:hypothetical protein ABIA39_002846 [Nocardia sp. GAS34]|jgi:hypothetical protein
MGSLLTILGMGTASANANILTPITNALVSLSGGTPHTK